MSPFRHTTEFHSLRWEQHTLSKKNPARLFTERESLEKENGKLRSERDSLLKENAKLLSARESLGKENTKLLSGPKSLAKENARLVNKLAFLTSENHLANSSEQILRASLRETKQRYHVLRTAHAHQGRKLADQTKQYEHLRHENRRLSATVAKAAAQRSSLEKQLLHYKSVVEEDARQDV